MSDATPTLASLQRDFESAYADRFGVELPEIRAVLVNLHTAVLGRRPSVSLASLRDTSGSSIGGSQGPAISRDVWFAEAFVPTPVLPRGALSPGESMTGPAIIEKMDCTVVLPPGFGLAVDELGNLRIDVPAPNGFSEPLQ